MYDKLQNTYLYQNHYKSHAKYIKNERLCFTTFPNPEKKVENTTRSGVFLTPEHGRVLKCGKTLSPVFDLLKGN